MRRFGLCFPLLALFAAAAAAEDPVTIKHAKLKAGDRVKVTTDDKFKTVQVVEFMGKKQTTDDDDAKSAVCVNEVITPAADEDGKPLKLKRTYEKFSETKGGKDQPAPPLNTPILIEKKGDKYEFTADGKPLGGFAKTLDDEFNKPELHRTKDLLPGKPVKPGDTWKIDGAKVAKAFNETDRIPLDPEKTTVTGKLLKTYQKGGKQFGVMEFAMESAFKDGAEGEKVKLKPGGTVTFKFTVDGCIDGTDPANTTRGRLSFKVAAETEGAVVTISTDINGLETEELLPKK